LTRTNQAKKRSAATRQRPRYRDLFFTFLWAPAAPKAFIDNCRTPHTEKLDVGERWKIINNGMTMEVTITIDDPDTFNLPWQAVQRYLSASSSK
jgi:hypothetical protein